MKRIYKFNNLPTLANCLSFCPTELRGITLGGVNSISFGTTPIAYSEKLIDNLFTIDLRPNSLREGTAVGGPEQCTNKDYFMSFWENDFISHEDEYLLVEFTASPTYGKNLLPLFSPFSAYKGLFPVTRDEGLTSSEDWTLVPLTSPLVDISPMPKVGVYVEYPSFSYNRDLLLWSFYRKK